MNGETHLAALIQALAPVLVSDSYVFVTLPGAYGEHVDLRPLASFAETEGLSLLIPMQEARRRGLDYDGVFRGIKLSVNSSPRAVGLTAAVSTALTAAGISANVIAATHHDYVFVPEDRATEAMATLSRLSGVTSP